MSIRKHINLHPLVMPILPDKPVGAHTDAQGLGHVAAFVTGATKTVVSTHLPQRFTVMVNEIAGESPIFIYFDLSAAILMVRIALDWPEGAKRTFVLCVGCKAAVSALAKGSPSSILGARLTSLFWDIADRGGPRVGGSSMAAPSRTRPTHRLFGVLQVLEAEVTAARARYLWLLAMRFPPVCRSVAKRRSSTMKR